MVKTEREESTDFSTWLDGCGLLHCHVPNGLVSNPRNVAIHKRMGLKRGVPDHLIFSDVPMSKGCRGVAVEMKRVKGSKMDDPDQLKWLADLELCGWIVYMANGADDAIDFMESLGFEHPQQKL